MDKTWTRPVDGARVHGDRAVGGRGRVPGTVRHGPCDRLQPSLNTCVQGRETYDGANGVLSPRPRNYSGMRRLRSSDADRVPLCRPSLSPPPTDAARNVCKKPIMPGQTLVIVVLAVLFGLTLVELWDHE